MSEVTPPPVNDRIVKVNIEDEMRGAYLDYAMSVIVGRALPDVRDGLKPVHRRVLYAMYDLGNHHNKPYKKSARVVGDVIGKYHPHGDTAVYDTIVRMAQSFSLRYPLVDGQGNFGSIDGDSAAAMRYTEVRMEKIADDLLADIEKETVDFGPNYDDSLKEPLVLPTRIPNLLVNGSSGIAVGMATNIPPHNLREVVDATIALIENPELNVIDLLKFVKGPDFPTGALMFAGSNLRKAYLTGRGSITLRGRAEIEPWKNDRERIIITEIPYQVNKAKLIEKVAELVREKRVEGISDLRDESDRQGMRIVIEVKKNENANIILNQIYKLTPLQQSFGIAMLAIHQNQPRIMNLREMIWAFIEHRKDVVLRRTAYELRKAEEKAHILEGLKIAVENIDEVVDLIKKSKNPPEAKAGLTARFALSEIQAQAILDMRLQRLTGLERDKIIEEYNQILALILDLKDILANEKRVYQIITEELKDVRERYGDDRRTEVVQEAADEFVEEDLVADEETLVTITHKGFVKRTDPSQFRAQHRGGRGIRGMATSEDDFAKMIIRTTNLTYLLCFTDKGRMYWLKVFKIPEAARHARGKAIVNLLALAPSESIRAILPVKEFDTERYIVMVTQQGVIKKTALSEFKNVRAAGIGAMSTRDGDQLVAAKITHGKDDIFLCTESGTSIRFNEDNVRPMGRAARGVTGINLSAGDHVVSMEVLSGAGDGNEYEILIVTELGYGKRTPIGDFRVQSRAGKGIISMKASDRNGKVVAACQVLPKDDVMLVTNKGQLIRVNIGGISEQGRYAQGVRVMSVSPGEKVVALEYMAEAESAEVAEVAPTGPAHSNGSGGEPTAGGNGAEGAE